MTGYYPIKSVSFVAREYWDSDDEIAESYFYDDFGGDNYHVTRNVWYAFGNDGCEPLTDEDETEECLDRLAYTDDDNCGDDYYDAAFDEAVRVAEAVAHAIALQNFFRERRKAEIAHNETPEPEVVERTVSCRLTGGWHTQNATYRPRVRRKGGRPIGNHGGGRQQSDDHLWEIRPVAVIVANNDRDISYIRVS